MAAEDDQIAFAMDDQEDVLNTFEDIEGNDDEQEATAASKDPLKDLLKHHPECIIDYAETIAPKIPLSAAIPDDIQLDQNHTSAPFLTQYERTAILGKRANQLSQNARPYIKVPEHVTSVMEIARMELEQKRLPYIIKRPMPDNTFEYWRLSDLILL